MPNQDDSNQPPRDTVPPSLPPTPEVASFSSEEVSFGSQVQTPSPPPAFVPPPATDQLGGMLQPPIQTVPAPSLEMPPPPGMQSPEVVTAPAPGGEGFFDQLRGLPIKMIAIVLVVVIIVGGGIWAGWRFFAKQQVAPKQINLSWWGLWEDSSIVTPLIAQYEAAHPNVKIHYVKQSPQDYRERLASQLSKAAGGPDIFRFHVSWMPMIKKELAPLPADIMDAKTFDSTFYPVAREALTSGGQLIGIPLMIDGLALYVNDDLLTAAGRTPPTTWDELRQTAVALTVRNQAGEIVQSGVALGTVGNVDHWQDILGLMMVQNGVDSRRLGDERMQDVLTFYTIFTTGDKVWDATLPPSTSAFAAGKVAMYFGPSWRALEIKNRNPALRFHVIPPPQLPKIGGEPDSSWASFWSEGVWSRSQNTKEAFAFLKFLSQKEQLEKLYTESSRVRLFGEPYSRRDMAELLTADPVVGAYVKAAPVAKTWYLASNTLDGEAGIASRISKYFEDAINKVLLGTSAKEALATVQPGVDQVLSLYGVH